MTDEILLSVKDLIVEYRTMDGIVYAVNGVSFDLKAGETFGLVGETGAGKTTIAKSILTILPTPPAKIVSGEILFKGKDLLKLGEREMAKLRGESISMIFQDPMTALNPVFTIGEQIAESIRLHQGIKRGDAELKAMGMLEMVGIPRERFDDYPHQFSGGMKQRVVIAIALACNPQLLLADEPTTALDVTIQAQVLELMAKLKEELHTSMIMISHDLGVVAKSCDKVAIMYAGSIVEYGTKYHVYAETMHPYTQGLFDSLPSINESSSRLKPIMGLMPNPMDLPPGCAFHPRCANASPECSTRAIPATEADP
ncbi:MAG: ABC transporter ATP-binding protein, partial [Spirochaetaceae bacterium]|nr:ABC transporter ATP-binding protein [Spirochaetaceae bacterium]